jgi:exosortase
MQSTAERAEAGEGAGADPVDWWPWIWAAVAAVVALWVFFPIVAFHPAEEHWALAEEWDHDPNYSYGYLIIPLALYFAWENKKVLRELPIRGSLWGLPILLAALVLFLTGIAGAVNFLTRFSVVALVPGVILYLLGWRFLRALAFPLIFLALMVPPPYFIWAQIATPLQEFAARTAEQTLFWLEVPVLRTGNVITLANTRLEVAEACSGLRSLMALFTTGIVFGYFFGRSPLQRILIVASSVPIAILVNAARVAGTGWLAYHWGADVATGYYHQLEGFGMFLVAFSLLTLVGLAILAVVPARRRTGVAS